MDFPLNRIPLQQEYKKDPYLRIYCPRCVIATPLLAQVVAET